VIRTGSEENRLERFLAAATADILPQTLLEQNRCFDASSWLKFDDFCAPSRSSLVRCWFERRDAAKLHPTF